MAAPRGREPAHVAPSVAPPVATPDASNLDTVVVRAALDSDFRAGLLHDARGTLAGMGIVIPPHLRVRFVERDADVDLMVVLPDLVPDTVGGPLDAVQLGHVAAGLAAGWSWATRGRPVT